jgi:hypothetical protein
MTEKAKKNSHPDTDGQTMMLHILGNEKKNETPAAVSTR